jgi:predicted nucleic acid-binding protein
MNQFQSLSALIWSVDARVALEWARIIAEGTAAGRPRSALDMVVAATAAAHGLTVATGNEKHFRDTGVP